MTFRNALFQKSLRLSLKHRVICSIVLICAIFCISCITTVLASESKVVETGQKMPGVTAYSAPGTIFPTNTMVLPYGTVIPEIRDKTITGPASVPVFNSRQTDQIIGQQSQNSSKPALVLNLSAAAPGITWQKSLGGSKEDWANSIQQTKDGGYIVAGYTYSSNGNVKGNHGQMDFWVVKLTSKGAISWQKCLGGSSDDRAYSIRQTTDGGYIVAGGSDSTNGNVKGNHGDDDYWVVKLTSKGAIKWQKCLGGSSYDESTTIQQTKDGGYIVAGNSFSSDGNVKGNHGYYGDYWVVKLTSNGAIKWQKCLGGSGEERANSIQQTTDGGYIVAGRSDSTNGDVKGNHGSNDFWVVKLTSNGAIKWQKSLGGSKYDSAKSIQQTKDGGYIVAGYTYSNNGNVKGNHGDYDYWVVKLTSKGAISWQKCLGGSLEDRAESIWQTTDGGYIVAGTSRSTDGNVKGNHGSNDYWVVKLTSKGVISWQKCLGGSSEDKASSIQQTKEGGFVVAGTSLSNTGDVKGNHGIYDYWVAKLKAK